MEKYGTIMMSGLFLLIMLVGIWVLLDKIADINKTTQLKIVLLTYGISQVNVKYRTVCRADIDKKTGLAININILVYHITALILLMLSMGLLRARIFLAEPSVDTGFRRSFFHKHLSLPILRMNIGWP